jgi:hypothetical protein
LFEFFLRERKVYSPLYRLQQEEMMACVLSIQRLNKARRPAAAGKECLKEISLAPPTHWCEIFNQIKCLVIRALPNKLPAARLSRALCLISA